MTDSSAVTLLVGTTKGAFVLTADAARGGFAVKGPFCDGWSINHFASDPETGTIWAGGGSGWSGAGVWRSADGESWTLSKLSNGEFDQWMMRDPDQAAAWGVPVPDKAPYTGEVDSVWSLAYVDGRLLAGAKPATLFDSRDGGVSFARVQSLTDHPTRPEWEPGAAGLTLHTILADRQAPDKLWLGISAAGVFASEDGGRSFERRTRRANADHSHDDGHDHGDEIGYCVHNMVRAPGGGDVLYQQNHHGVWRSADGGRSWHNRTAGLPSTFGFPIAVHPRDPDTIWVLPLNGDSMGRFPPDAQAAVWKSTDGGLSWADCRAGLPQDSCFFTVLRQAMATDQATPAGVYFGTNSGSVFASADEGATWSEVARHLPTVLCVEVLAQR